LQVFRIRDASCPKTFTSENEFSVGGVEEIAYSNSKLFLNNLSNDGTKERFEKPCQAREFRFAQGVREFVDLNADVAERENLLEFFAAHFDVELDIDTAVVELERGNTLVCEAEESFVCFEPKADFVGADGEALDFDGG